MTPFKNKNPLFLPSPPSSVSLLQVDSFFLGFLTLSLLLPLALQLACVIFVVEDGSGSKRMADGPEPDGAC